MRKTKYTVESIPKYLKDIKTLNELKTKKSGLYNFLYRKLDRKTREKFIKKIRESEDQKLKRLRTKKYDNKFLLKTARDFTTISAFAQAEPSLYVTLKNRCKKDKKLKLEAFKHFNRLVRSKYTDQELANYAKQYDQKKIFKRENIRAYDAAKTRNRKNPGFMDKICAHMKGGNIRWTEELVTKEFKARQNVSQVLRACHGAIEFAKRHKVKNPGFIANITSHMISDINCRELEAKIEFEKQLAKHNLIIEREVSIPIRDNGAGRVDFFIRHKTLDLCFAIEYKHDLSFWTKGSLSHQVAKYNRSYRERKGFVGTYLVSPKGKYGISDKEFLEVLKHLKKTNEIILPTNSLINKKIK